jgi:hypothetical protein
MPRKFAYKSKFLMNLKNIFILTQRVNFHGYIDITLTPVLGENTVINQGKAESK